MFVPIPKEYYYGAPAIIAAGCPASPNIRVPTEKSLWSGTLRIL
jgi:hypothetical protein